MNFSVDSRNGLKTSYTRWGMVKYRRYGSNNRNITVFAYSISKCYA